MARPKTEIPVDADKALEEAGLTPNTGEINKDQVIFVGSGVVWGGKIGGKKAIARFDQHRLFKTSDKKIIEAMRSENYPEVTYDQLKTFIEADTYFESLSNLIRKKLPKNKHQNTFSENEVKDILS